MRRAPLRPALLLAALLAVVLATAAPVGADARRDRERARAEKAAAAGRLDVLQANDDQLEQAVADLDEHVRTQSAGVAAARQAVEAAEAASAEAARRLEATRASMTGLRDEVVARAVAVYIRPGGDGLDQLVGSRSALEAARKHALLESVHGHDADVLDQLGAAEEDEERDRQAAEAAAAAAAERRREAEDRLAELEGARAEQARLHDALQVRISEVLSEVEALAAQEQALTRAIAGEEAAARAAAARRAAEAAPRTAPSRTSSGAAAPPASAGPARSGGMVWPARGPQTSGFGTRWGRLHAGIDIGAPTGTPIFAAAAGTVSFSGTMSGYGNVVTVDHGGGLTTLYAHQSRIAASVGQQVGAGDVIGYVGSTGRSTGPHLHFETRVGGTPRNPLGYL
jgi:murein DD-endopeptidase MepM/ murein hydrolase activator NlpD